MSAGFKDFTKSTAKLAIAIFLAGLALIVAIAFFIWARESYEQHSAKKFEAIQEWNADLSPTLGMQLKAKTKLVSGELLASINLAGYPSYLSAPSLLSRNRNAEISLHFLDKDGFRVFSKALPVNTFTSIVDGSGQKIGLSGQFSDHISAENYQRFARLDIEWTLETKIPAAALAETKDESTVPDHCAPGISKAERLKRLAQHGAVRETGNGSYSAGNKSVHFFYDGSLMDCH